MLSFRRPRSPTRGAYSAGRGLTRLTPRKDAPLASPASSEGAHKLPNSCPKAVEGLARERSIGPISAPIRRFEPYFGRGSAQNWSTFDQLWPSWSKFRSIWPNFDPILTKFGQFGPNCVETNFGRSRPNCGSIWPSSANFGRLSTPALFDLGQLSLKVGQLLQTLDQLDQLFSNI